MEVIESVLGWSVGILRYVDRNPMYDWMLGAIQFLWCGESWAGVSGWLDVDGEGRSACMLGHLIGRGYALGARGA